MKLTQILKELQNWDDPVGACAAELLEYIDDLKEQLEIFGGKPDWEREGKKLKALVEEDADFLEVLDELIWGVGGNMGYSAELNDTRLRTEEYYIC